MTYQMLSIVARQDRKWGLYAYTPAGARDCLLIDASRSVVTEELHVVARRHSMDTYIVGDQLRARATYPEA